MWSVSKIESTDSNTKFHISENNSAISNKRFLELLVDSKSFRAFYNGVLKKPGFDAFFWENKPVTKNNLSEIYECNIINSDFLASKSPDTHTFSQYFADNKNVVSFLSLGKDAKLVVPCPKKGKPGYAHIGTFIRKAGDAQIHEFWSTTARLMLEAVGEEPKWLSTSGLGVFWLHARIDSRPKYYQTREYKSL